MPVFLLIPIWECLQTFAADCGLSNGLQAAQNKSMMDKRSWSHLTKDTSCMN